MDPHDAAAPSRPPVRTPPAGSPWAPPTVGGAVPPRGVGVRFAALWLVVGVVVGAATNALATYALGLPEDGHLTASVADGFGETGEIDVRYVVLVRERGCATIEDRADEDRTWDDLPGSEVQVRDEHDELLGWATLPWHGDDGATGCSFATVFHDVRESTYYQVGNAFRGWLVWEPGDVDDGVLDAGVEFWGG